MKRILLGMLMVVAGCTRTVDGGPEASETRTLETFNRVSVKDGLSVQYVDGDPAVTIDSQQEVLKVIVTAVVSGELRVFIKPGVTVTDLQWTTVKITGHDLRQVSAEDASSITASDITGSPFTAVAKDASSIELRGETQLLHLQVEDASDADTLGLAAKSVDVQLKDASSASVDAIESVGGTLTDGAALHVKGTTDFTRLVVTDGAKVSAL